MFDLLIFLASSAKKNHKSAPLKGTAKSAPSKEKTSSIPLNEVAPSAPLKDTVKSNVPLSNVKVTENQGIYFQRCINVKT